MERVDRLTPVFERFPPEARVQFAGHLRGIVDIEVTEPVGHIHWLKSGELAINDQAAAQWLVNQPSVVFVPGATPHTLKSTHGAELVCSQFEFGHRFCNPLTVLEPAILVLPLVDVPELAVVHGLMMDEAFSERCGTSIAASDLLRYALMVLLRHVIKTSTAEFGPLKALGDASILKAVTAIHREPANAWTLERLADVASMSRATFARRFRELMGQTPLDYLTDWRLTVAQSLIAQGVPIKTVATDVGYTSTAVLSRVFTKRIGLGPRQWALKKPDKKQTSANLSIREHGQCAKR